MDPHAVDRILKNAGPQQFCSPGPLRSSAAGFPEASIATRLCSEPPLEAMCADKREQVTEIFRRYDKNGDGGISVEELTEVMKAWVR